MKPLDDIKILSLEQYGAGPFGSLHLADLGAEVIKIEDPNFNGDVGRYVPPFNKGTDSLFHETFNRGKKSIVIDINSDEGRKVFNELVKKSDVVYSNFRGDVPEKLKITYDYLKSINKKIVCVSLTGFGMTGPRSSEPGYDYIMQGLTGWMNLTGEPDGPPTKSGLSLVDYSGGLIASIAILAGVHSARRTGEGMDCDLSLYDTALSLLTYPATWWLSKEYEVERSSRSSHPSLVPFQLFKGEDEWFVVGCAKEKFWERLRDLLEDERLRDEKFSNFSLRFDNKKELITILDEIFSQKKADEWLDLLKDKQIPSGPINSLKDVFDDEHAISREMFFEYEHPELGKVKQVLSPVNVGKENKKDIKRAPMYNEHTENILRDRLNYSEEEIQRLKDNGVIT
ncbi:CoA transferase [Candidatus Actinomarina sp.]|jgi:crotonobetainyl-CoA:carnitine CoA-transferase CaiB-like acyl-CoA transferase|nr:CoA transferase [Candidatus Actinomarina sp.]MDA9593489.1 CoA transferase [Candidatus Actinomarina sp.]|tara:strand:- start:1329 stop:2522 length:1194 start_codon:yes stop_codon:yes gene_type:complete